MTVDVVALGLSTLDISVNHFDPEWLNADNTPMDGIASFAGGDATNQAIILNKLGKSVRLNTLVGKDDMGDILLARMKTSGLNMTSVKQKNDVKNFGFACFCQTKRRAQHHQPAGQQRRDD